MKKIIIPIIAAAIIGVGGGVTAMMNRASVASADDTFGEEVEVKSGNYYLNGDVDSGLWIVVTPETISLKGDDIDTSMREAIAKLYEVEVEEFNEEAMQQNVDKNTTLYCEEKPYLAEVVYCNSNRYRCCIFVDRYNRPVENLEDLRSSSAAFRYNDTTDTIHLGLFGDFTLVE